jgi:hypothetical protein
MTVPSLLTPNAGSTAYTPAVPAIRDRLERIMPVLLVTGVFLLAVISITPWPVGAYEDDAIYTVLGKALATGEGYRMINLPGTPHATHYPPGYPLLLALLWNIAPEFPDNVVVFKFANALLLALAALGAYWFVRVRLKYSPLAAAAIAAAGTASLAMLQLAALVLSEPLFIVFLFLALLAIERSAASGRMRDAALAGLLLGALCLVRTIGVVAVAGGVMVLLLHRRIRSAAVVVAVSAMFLVPWQLWVGAHQSELATILHGKYGPYGSWLAEGYRTGGIGFARGVIVENLASTANTLSYLFMPVQFFWPRLVALVALTFAVVGGGIVIWKRAPSVVAFVALYLILIVIWPFDPYRFLLALWPVLAIVVGAAIYTLWGWRPSGGARVVLRVLALGGAACILSGHAAWNWQEYEGETWTNLQRRAGMSARPLVQWVVQNTRPDDVLSTEHDVLLYLYTGRRGVPTSTFLPSQRVKRFTPEDNAFWVASMVRTYEPRYFITGWPPHVAAADTLSSGPGPMLRRVGAIPNHVIFERATP